MTTRNRSMAGSVGKMMVKYHTEDKQNLETRSACYGCASSLQKTAQNKAEPFVLKSMSFSFDVYGEKLKEKCCMRASGCCRVTNTLYMQLFIVLVSVSYANWSGISRTHKKNLLGHLFHRLCIAFDRAADTKTQPGGFKPKGTYVSPDCTEVLVVHPKHSIRFLRQVQFLR